MFGVSDGSGAVGGGILRGRSSLATAIAASGTKPDAFLATAAGAVRAGGAGLGGSEWYLFTRFLGCSDREMVSSGLCLNCGVGTVSVSGDSVDGPVSEGGSGGGLGCMYSQSFGGCGFSGVARYFQGFGGRGFS